MLKCLQVIFCLGFVSFVITAGCAEYERNKVIENHCGSCHPTTKVYSEKRSKKEWRRLVYGMKTRGLELTLQEEKKVFNVLFENYSLK